MMTDPDDTTDWAAGMVRDHYNPPPETPREEMWEAIQGRITSRGPGAADLTPRGPTTAGRVSRPLWLALAASAVLAVGVGIGRMSAGPVEAPQERAASAEAREGGGRRVSAARVAAVEHLYRSEPLVALVKADVARGSLSGEVATWARELLTETRLLLDAGLDMDPEVVGLLGDLELVLLQTVLVANGEVAEDRLNEELGLLREGLDERNVLPRIQAVMPVPGMAGT